jgi:hypothetical protein
MRGCEIVYTSLNHLRLPAPKEDAEQWIGDIGAILAGAVVRHRRMGIADETDGTLTVRMGDPMSASYLAGIVITCSSGCSLLQRRVFAAADEHVRRCNRYHRQPVQMGLPLCACEYAGQTRQELRLCRSMLIEAEDARYSTLSGTTLGPHKWRSVFQSRMRTVGVADAVSVEADERAELIAAVSQTVEMVSWLLDLISRIVGGFEPVAN